MVDEYKFKNKAKKRLNIKSAVLLGFAILCFVAGLYLLFLTQAPRLTFLKRSPDVTKVTQNRIIVEKAGIDEFIFEGGEEALEKGAWHRFPDRGDPINGGNFIVSAHRFVFDINPTAASEKSSFYNIEKINEGDTITIHWEGEKYEYKVAKRYKVKPTDIHIEDKTEDHILTMYSCTLEGRLDGRIVIEAKPQFEVANPSNSNE